MNLTLAIGVEPAHDSGAPPVHEQEADLRCVLRAEDRAMYARRIGQAQASYSLFGRIGPSSLEPSGTSIEWASWIFIPVCAERTALSDTSIFATDHANRLDGKRAGTPTRSFESTTIERSRLVDRVRVTQRASKHVSVKEAA